MNTLDRIDAAEMAALDDFFRAAPPDLVVSNGLLRLQREGALVLKCDTYNVLGFNRAFGISETQPAWDGRVRDLIGGEALLANGTIPICIRAGDHLVAGTLSANGFAEMGKGDARWILTGRTATEPLASTYPIRELQQEQAPEFDAVFRRTRDMPESLGGWAARLIRRDRWRCFGAFDGERVIATGAVFVRDDFAWLGFGSTLAEYRGRGLQAALIQVRIDAARALGVSLLTGGTGISSDRANAPSFLNFRRTGFALAYEQRSFCRPVRIEA